jgi:enoyl-CoA hydratase/carnithine racemase
VNEVTQGKAMEAASQLASRSPRATAHIKRLTRSAAQTPLVEGIKVERNLFMDLMTTHWAIDAMKACARNLAD